MHLELPIANCKSLLGDAPFIFGEHHVRGNFALVVDIHTQHHCGSNYSAMGAQGFRHPMHLWGKKGAGRRMYWEYDTHTHATDGSQV